MISVEQLKECLQIQQHIKHRGKNVALANLLVKKKYLTRSQIESLAQSSGKEEIEENAIVGTSKRTLTKGDCFSHFEIQEKIGQGGMGVVYRALDTRLQRVVALKLTSRTDQRNIERFQQEASAIAQLEHPNIVKLYEVGDTPQQYFALEYIAGKDLSSLIQHRKIKPKFAAYVIYKTALAVEAAHEKGIIHRDIKPSNIMIGQDKQVKLMDFGLAKITDIKEQFSQTKGIVGTPAYMSPEQVDGKKVTKSTDIYSLGATFYEALTGRPPFQGSTSVNIMLQILEQELLLPSKLKPDIPRDLETICLKCLEKSPQKRYRNVKELAQDVENFIQGHPITARRPYLWERFIKWGKRHKLPCVIGAMFGVIFFSAIIGYLFLTKQYTRQLKQKKQDSLVVAERVLQILEKVNYIYLRSSNLKKTFDALQKLDVFQEESVSITILAAYGYLYATQTTDEEFRHSLELYDQMLKENPNSWKAYLGKSYLYISRQQKREAVENVNMVIKLNPQLALPYLYLGKLAFEQKRYREAEENLLKALQLEPNFMNALQTLANLYERKQLYRKAEEIYNKALEMSPMAYNYISRGKFYHNQKYYKKAEKDYTQAIISAPSDTRGYIQRAILYINQKQYHKAQQDFDIAFTLEPNNKKFLSLVADAYGKAKCSEKAIDYYGKVIALSPQSQHVYKARGNIYLSLKNYDKALADYSSYLRLNPKDSLVYLARGKIYHSLKNYDKTLADYSSYLRLNPKDSLVYVARGKIYHSLKNYDKALADYNSYLRLNPRGRLAYFDRGGIYEKQKKYQKAIADFTRYIEIKPQFANSYYRRALLYKIKKNYLQAIKDCDMYIKLAPNSSFGYRLQGELYESLGKYAEAMAAYTKCIEIKPDFKLSLRCGQFYEKEKEYLLAIAAYTKCIKIKPNFKLSFLCGQLYEKEGKYSLAMAIYDRCIKQYPKKADIIYLARSKLYQNLEKYNKAHIESVKYIKLCPNKVGGYLLRARIYKAQKNYIRAIECCDVCLKINPKSIIMIRFRALLNIIQKKCDKAIIDYTKAIELESNARDYFHRGKAYNKQGKYQKAIADWQQAIELGFPDQRKARRLIWRAKKRLKQRR